MADTDKEIDEATLDLIVLQAIREENNTVYDTELKKRIIETFPSALRFPELKWGSTWDWWPVEQSLMRLLKSGLISARKDHRGRLVDWKAVDVLGELAKINS